ncbi:DUF6030 family protein [Neorhizobium alkalisoli]|uniref:Uncharacterized protein n=1 Tax=Neorhizobium alkalisoli TaxID=528178 RepID=A0A561R223_9HYPH|nr:DUF6030 family protein [Neorhizobium alkalisoli]TWF56656.1 hypothetical protein FHW37_102294 [Neorhizobium alkalisoli]
MPPHEEKVKFATPADRRRRRSGGFLVFWLLLVAVLGGLAATVLAVNDGRNYLRLVHQFHLEQYLLPAAPAPDLKINRQRQLSPAIRYPASLYPGWLLRASLERATTLRAASGPAMEDRCRQLGGESGPVAEYKARGHEWECNYLRPFGDAPEAASLFVQAKGIVAGELHTFRIKTSFTDPAQDDEVLASAISAIDQFELRLSPESRAYLEDKLRNRVSFKSTLENFRAVFGPEMLDQRRFNLVLVARPATSECRSVPETALTSITAVSIACLPLQSGRSWAPPAAG